ncbi:hypothetical protein [Algoriphagus sp.]|uniref:hypothetical protein n=1 Tax=Algoriphagus sp. TaxID=1872435 RepID=UPI003269C1D1
MNNFNNYIAKASGVLVALFLIPFVSFSQIPKGIPKPTGPIDFSETSNVVIFIVIPAVIIIVFLIFRKRIIRVMRERQERRRKD